MFETYFCVFEWLGRVYHRWTNEPRKLHILTKKRSDCSGMLTESVSFCCSAYPWMLASFPHPNKTRKGRCRGQSLRHDKNVHKGFAANSERTLKSIGKKRPCSFELNKMEWTWKSLTSMSRTLKNTPHVCDRHNNDEPNVLFSVITSCRRMAGQIPSTRNVQTSIHF